MTYLLQLLPLIGIWTMALVSQGPDVLVTARYATARSRREGVLVGLGIAVILLMATAGFAPSPASQVVAGSP
jgi:threonine/homoserine/homoserine lactone efflux protein